MDNILNNALEKSMDYQSYLDMINKEIASEDTDNPMFRYVKLNAQRIKRLNKTSEVNEKTVKLISSIPFDMEWVIITEAWCGDAAQNVPYLNKLAEACDNVNLRLVLRDENLDYIDAHLTNGSRSIPKLVVYRKENMEELGSWGPRPEPIQAKVVENQKSSEPMAYEKLAEQIHGWYAKDKNAGLDRELTNLFEEILEETAVH